MKSESATWWFSNSASTLALSLWLLFGPAVSTAQTFQQLHAFTCVWNDDTGWDCTAEGIGSKGTLLQASDGNFYGASSGGGRWGCGTVFRVTIDGTLTTLAHFNGTNGASPQGSLTQTRDGNLYGATG